MITPALRPSASLSGTRRTFSCLAALETGNRNYQLSSKDSKDGSEHYHSLRNSLASSMALSGAGQIMAPLLSLWGSASQ